LEADEAFKTPTLTEIVVPDVSFFERAFTTLVSLLIHRGNPVLIITGCGIL
jgi:hypothetical protein